MWEDMCNVEHTTFNDQSNVAAAAASDCGLYYMVQLQHHELVAANNRRLYNSAGIHYGELLGAEERQIILHVPLYTLLLHAYFCSL